MPGILLIACIGELSQQRAQPAGPAADHRGYIGDVAFTEFCIHLVIMERSRGWPPMPYGNSVRPRVSFAATRPATILPGIKPVISSFPSGPYGKVQPWTGHDFVLFLDDTRMTVRYYPNPE